MRMTLTAGVLTLEAPSRDFPVAEVLAALEAAGCLVAFRGPTSQEAEEGPANVVPLDRPRDPASPLSPGVPSVLA